MVVFYLVIGLDVIIEDIPKVLNPKEQKVGSVRILVPNLFSEPSAIQFEYRYWFK